MIERKLYLDKLIRRKEDGMVKVITGIRRCGKSYLLFDIYHKYLNSLGVDDNHIIELALDTIENIKYRNPINLSEYVKGLIKDKENMYYIFLDEIQMVEAIDNPYLPGSEQKITFVDVILGLMKIPNADIYVTGSNSKMLSTDILTEFRGRGEEIRVHPLSYKEFYSAYGEDKRNAWRDYQTYGGMPLCLLQKTAEDKSNYLKSLFNEIYLSDIVERNKIVNDVTVLENLLDVLASSVGSLTNPSRISKTFASVDNLKISDDTIAKYIGYFIDSFMIYQVKRYDVKGRGYIGSPFKYYYADCGLRNARFNFRQQEETHVMENILYNELLIRDYNVDVGLVEVYGKDKNGKSERKQLEVDFIVTKDSKKYYIQSALSVAEREKQEQEVRPYHYIRDSYAKIVVVKDNIMPRYDENGVYYVGIEEFLLNDALLNM